MLLKTGPKRQRCPDGQPLGERKPRAGIQPKHKVLGAEIVQEAPGQRLAAILGAQTACAVPIAPAGTTR